MTQKDSIQSQQKIDSKITQDIKKTAEEIKIQTREEIAVKNKERIKETELKRKKDLEEEIIRLKFQMQVRNM